MTTAFVPYVIADPTAQRGNFLAGRSYPGQLSRDGRVVAIADEDGRLRAIPVSDAKVDIDGWRAQALQNGTGQTAEDLTGAVEARLRNMESKIEKLGKGGRGGKAFASVREALRSDVRSIAELVGAADYARELWDKVPLTGTRGKSKASQ